MTDQEPHKLDYSTGTEPHPKPGAGFWVVSSLGAASLLGSAAYLRLMLQMRGDRYGEMIAPIFGVLLIGCHLILVGFPALGYLPVARWRARWPGYVLLVASVLPPALAIIGWVIFARSRR